MALLSVCRSSSPQGLRETQDYYETAEQMKEHND